jgi:formylglycine-generating enzyme required for sulfatase activity
MRAWVWRLLPVVTVLATSPLLPSPDIARAEQTCPAELLRKAIAQLPDDQQRPEAQKTLKQCGEVAVHPLASALNDDAPATRLYAANTLGQMGWDAKAAVPDLMSVSQGDRDLQVRRNAVQALREIGESSKTYSEQLQGWQIWEIQDLKDLEQQLDKLLTELEKDKQNWGGKAGDLDNLRRTRNGLQTQLRNLTDQPSYQGVAWGQSHPWAVGGGVGVIGLAAAYGAVFWLRPRLLLKLGDGLIHAIAKIPHMGTALSAVLKTLVPLKYHPRVLDAWVADHWQQVEKAFLELNTVRDRQIHIDLPVRLGQNQTFVNQLSGSDLATTFQKRPAVLLIVGEGGSGKTSLACQIAQWGLNKQLASHRLLPVLIETELDDKKTLTEAIRGQLNALISEDIPADLLEKLLQRQRILAIVDHLSEMGEATRKQVIPDMASFPAKALVITSRLEEPLGRVPKTILKPLRIEADRLLGFMQAYVRWKLNKQDDPFVDDEYAVACDRLRRMVGQRNITVLLARLYAEEMIRQQQGTGDLPSASVPDLMLSYLNQLNSKIEPANQRDRLQIQREMLVIAWECLKQTYRPIAALREAVIQALRETQPGEDPTAQDKACSTNLDYLETRLRLVQTLEPGDKIRIVLDPLAEYLAATCLVDRSRRQENPEAFWQQFLESIDPILQQSNDSPQAIQGFLLAVRDCCLVKQKEARIPAGVPEELARRAGLDPEELRRDEEKRRIRLLISELSAPELEFRIEAAEKLGRRGVAAREAAPNLIGMMENRNQELEARQAAAQTLGNLGIGAENLLALLTDSTEELAVRRSAAESLGMMKAGQAELLNLLESDDQPLPIRQGAARALSLIGAASGEAVPMLLVELKGEAAIAQIKSIPIWKEPLTHDLTLDLVAIPAGEFLMGSPPDEVGRDLYQYSFPELKDVDVEAQHQVTVRSFSMSQFPITQAQWRFVAQLPKIDRDLALDPANFKGDRRPVELVSWHDAMEFCARLSQHTGKTYRLPSEAEWEYACRALPSPPTPLPEGEGSIYPPFHLGDTLSTDLANYNGTYAYGKGVQGLYRQKTTEVGSFGIVNAFGLSDMHGNVWEWCLDHWHPSYQDAPIDGSAWETDGDVGEASLQESRYRVLRGGSWYSNPGYCRSANRIRSALLNQDYSIGFRVVCVSPWTL